MSYTFGLCGPCVSTDTACSSSLVAAHLAHKGLLNGEATSAVAAGVNLMLSSLTTVAICQLQVSAPACNSLTAQHNPWSGLRCASEWDLGLPLCTATPAWVCFI